MQNGLTPTTARYLKFESLTAVGNNAGLNEFEVYTAFTGTLAVINPHPPDVPLIISEPNAPASKAFMAAAERMAAQISLASYNRSTTIPLTVVR